MLVFVLSGERGTQLRPDALGVGDHRQVSGHIQHDEAGSGDSRGDLSAVVRLKRYLQILSHAFATGLSRMRSLGPPPAPDASYGRAYITAAGRMVAAIQHLGRAVGKLDAPGIATANGELKAASTAANTAARRPDRCGSLGRRGRSG